MDLAVRVVESVEEATEHIRRYSTGHTEGIVASDVSAIAAFRAGVDAAAGKHRGLGEPGHGGDTFLHVDFETIGAVSH